MPRTEKKKENIALPPPAKQKHFRNKQRKERKKEKVPVFLVSVLQAGYTEQLGLALSDLKVKL